MYSPKTTNQTETKAEILVDDEEVERLVEMLPKTIIYGNVELVKYQNFWCPNVFDCFKSILAFQRHFVPRDTDLIIASFPKTGTTWLKSLLFSVANRDKYPINQSPLHKNHPHELVFRLEVEIYGDAAVDYPCPRDLEDMPSPRIFNTHMPYTSLPTSVQESSCKVIYTSRNAMDTLVSLWHFSVRARKKLEGDAFKAPSMEEFVEKFYRGEVMHGPFFEHVVEYWNQSLERPDKVLFMKYEDLKDDPMFWLKKLAEFIGMPFSIQEENDGVTKQILELCGINKLKEIEGNEKGVINKYFEKKSYYRKGEVGDWANHFTPQMVQRMDALIKQKFDGTGLSFKM